MVLDGNQALSKSHYPAMLPDRGKGRMCHLNRTRSVSQCSLIQVLTILHLLLASTLDTADTVLYLVATAALQWIRAETVQRGCVSSAVTADQPQNRRIRVVLRDIQI